MKNIHLVSFLNNQEKILLERERFKDFNDFFLFDLNKSNLENSPKRIHKNKKTGAINRSTICIIINNTNYFLKRTANKSYNCIKNEFKALEYIKEFNLIPAQVAASGFDDKKQEGFILFKELNNYFSLFDIFNNKTSNEVQNDFINKKDVILNNLNDVFKKFQASQYYYRDWMDKHIFINFENCDILLIDLERFLPQHKLPIKYKVFPFLKKRLRKKERLKFKEVSNKFITHKVK